MQKNLYYRNMLRRENRVQLFFYELFMMFATLPRLWLEVFIRKDFGRRYFRIGPVLTTAGLLGILPTFFSLPIFHGGDFGDTDSDDEGFYAAQRSSSISPYLGWYIFLGLFVIMSIKHLIDRRRNHPDFDFKKYSLYSGKINPVFYKIKIKGIDINTRLIETFLEPLPFFILGIILWLLNQHLGMFLIVCSIFYCGSYLAAYKAGDDFILDKIDEMICNESLKKTFVDGKREDEESDFRYVGEIPKNEETRKKIEPVFTEEVFEAT